MKSEKIVAKGYDIVAEKYYKFFKPSESKEIIGLKKLIEKIPKDSLILDAGCGAGIPAAKFLVKEGYKVVGIDISKKMINLAKKNVPQGKFRIMGLYDLKFKDKTFDAVVSFFTILHLEKSKVPKVFREFNRILKDKKYLLFSINRGKGQGYFEFLGKRTFFSGYLKKEIKEILRKSNFKIIWQKDFVFRKKSVKEQQMYYLVQKSLKNEN